MSPIVSVLSTEGVTYSPVKYTPEWLSELYGSAQDSELVSLLSQLVEEGYCYENDGAVRVTWSTLYELAQTSAYQDSFHLFGLPKQEAWKPVLASNGSLADTGFSITLSGWIDPEGNRFPGNVVREGAVLTADLRKSLIFRETWDTIEAVREFYSRPDTERTPEANRLGWARIRFHAIGANAELSNFLKNTIVLSPGRLKLALRKGQGAGAGVVEVVPEFDGAPKRWLEIFDRFAAVQAHYQIPDGEGLTHIMMSPEVKTVLREIKRMPGRRVAGERAEAFVRNPFALLGPDAGRVIDPEQYEHARERAGISFSRFTADILHDENTGAPYEVAIIVQDVLGARITKERIPFPDKDSLVRFVITLKNKILRGAQCHLWQGHELEILDDTSDQLQMLERALEQWRSPNAIKLSEILDLSRYSERIEGVGEENPYYSPFIARKSLDGGWFPENVSFGLCYTSPGSSQPVAINLDEKGLAQLQDAIIRAKAHGEKLFAFPGCPDPLSVRDAEAALSGISVAVRDVTTGRFNPNEAERHVIKRQSLVVKPNVAELDYEEKRKTLETAAGPLQAHLPRSLKPQVALMAHQLDGVAWLQHLWANAPERCRGALLADDMGLGKTIQILTFLAHVLEEDPSVKPFLIVAPVSLLENWKEEIDKFFTPGALPVLTLYGPTLSSMRVRREDLDQEVIDRGLVRLLKRDWLGGAKMVLTTYETLRDLEFSLAGEQWAVVVCDEAQKIKNPNAMVTRAAKKQNARFKIACTGTPVENTLADLWCIFDFIQPGLLGALNEFGSRYRRPIEAETDTERERVEELRCLINPQTKRRVKSEVAKDLPAKINGEECRKLQMTERQRAMYADAIARFKHVRAGDARRGSTNHLGLLLLLRRICSDPRPINSLPEGLESVGDIVKHSPKMFWLLEELDTIRSRGEKAIIFCEFRDLQRTLQRVVSERMGLTPDIINGETTTNAMSTASRHKRISAFQRAPGFGVIILSPLAVGFGVNIQQANHVIHFTRTWNPAKEDQATDRAYRIGQTRDVFVHCPVVVAEDFVTFDAKLDTLLEWKRGLSRDMLNGTGELQSADFADLQNPGGGKLFTNAAGAKTTDASADIVTRQVARESDVERQSDLVFLEPSLKPLFQRVAAEKLPLPEIGYEIQDEYGCIVATTELAWPDLKVAVVLLEENTFVAELEKRGWVVFRNDEVGTDMQRLLVEIRGQEPWSRR